MSFISEYRRLLNELEQDFTLNYRKLYKQQTRNTYKNSQRKRFVELYKEIILILYRIQEECVRFWDLQQQELLIPIPSGNSHSDLQNIVKQKQEQSDLIKLDVKNLFHWLFTLEESLQNQRKTQGKRQVFSKNIILFRNIFLVHLQEKRQKIPRFRQLAFSFKLSPDLGPELLLVDISQSQQSLGFRAIEKDVITVIPQISSEVNLYEKICIILENLDKLPQQLFSYKATDPRHFSNRLSQYGGRSPKLIEVLNSILETWKKEIKYFSK